MKKSQTHLLLIPVFVATMALAFVSLLVSVARADTINVCAACSVTSIQTAVNQANPGDTIQLSAETYDEIINITQSLTIAGATDGFTILNGDSMDTVVTVAENVTVTLQNLTIRNGEAAERGGGVINSGRLTIIDSSISSNRAVFEGPGIYNEGHLVLETVEVRQNFATGNTNLGGGGIFNAVGGHVTISQNSVVANNVAMAGAGILNRGVVTVTNSMISGNRADVLGGGVANDGRLYMSNSTLMDNESEDDAGGLFNTDTAVLRNVQIVENVADATEGSGGAVLNVGTITVTQSSLNNNSANDGGAFHNLGDASLTNVTISGNSAVDAGAGLYSEGNTAVLLHVTFFNNIAEGSGSVIAQVDGPITVTNSILARGVASGATACSGVIVSQGGNLSDDTSCDLLSEQDLNGVVVNLEPLNADGVHLPEPFSAPIDNALAESCASEDQLDRARPFGAGCDSGAIEAVIYQLFAAIVSTE